MGTGIVKPDSFEWRKVKPYLLYVGMFVATIYANMRALQHSNVETIIVFRAVSRAFCVHVYCTPHVTWRKRESSPLPRRCAYACLPRAVRPAHRVRARLGLPRPPASLFALDIRAARRRRRMRGLCYDRQGVQAQRVGRVHVGLGLLCHHQLRDGLRQAHRRAAPPVRLECAGRPRHPRTPPTRACMLREAGPCRAHPTPPQPLASLSRAQCGVLRCTQTQYRCHRWG